MYARKIILFYSVKRCVIDNDSIMFITLNFFIYHPNMIISKN